jgi:hypothetical protein
MSSNRISAAMPLFLFSMIGAWLGNAYPAPEHLLSRGRER